MGVLSPALRGHRGGGALEDLQKRLLHALAGDVARDRRVIGLAGDLVDLVDVDDPRLGLLHVEVGRLDQLQEDVLDVLADVARLGQRSRVGDRERNVEDPRKGLRQERLAATGGAEQEDVRLLELNLLVVRLGHLDALVVVVDGDRQRALRGLLSDDVLVQDRVDLLRLGKALELEGRGRGELLVDDLVAEIDALVADVDARPGDELLDLTLGLSAEAAEKLLVRLGWACQALSPFDDAARRVDSDYDTRAMGRPPLLLAGGGRPFKRPTTCSELETLSRSRAGCRSSIRTCCRSHSCPSHRSRDRSGSS